MLLQTPVTWNTALKNCQTLFVRWAEFWLVKFIGFWMF
jgi:hypothetical protein